MRGQSGLTDATASNIAAISRHEPNANNGDILPNSEWFAVMSLELWRQKVAAHLQCLCQQSDPAGYSDRTLRAWSSGENEPPARVLALLLRSADGGKVLTWVMRDCEQPWWIRHKKAERIYNALQAELRE